MREHPPTVRSSKLRKLAIVALVVTLSTLPLGLSVKAATTGFELNTSGLSHIAWMFNGSSWDTRNGWNTTAGNQAGKGDHLGSDYYADDWNLGSGNYDCGQEVRAPFAGNIIHRSSTAAAGYGYQIIIQADANNTFAYRATHLQKDSLTGSSHVNAGDVIGRMGGSPNHTLINGIDYWSGSSSTACHLHSVLYQNINQNYNGSPAINTLRNGGSIGLSGGANTFAARFQNDGIISSGQSACATFSQAGVTFFNSAQCTGSTRQFTSTGFYNLTDYGWNDAAKSMSIQSGWSARIWQDTNKGGSSVCFTGTKWDMSLDKYENGSAIVSNGQATISSVQIYNNTSCYTAPVQVNCGNYPGNGIMLFGGSQCTGTSKTFTASGLTNLSDIGFDNSSKSIFVKSGMSARIYEHPNRGGGSRCVTGSMWDLPIDKYENGAWIAPSGASTVSSIDVYQSSNCAAPACQTFSSTGIVLFGTSICGGTQKQFTTAGFRNLTDSSINFNDATRSIYVQPGWSVRIYEHTNGTGATRCISWTMWDLNLDKYDNGVQIASNGSASVTSIRVYNNGSCR